MAPGLAKQAKTGGVLPIVAKRPRALDPIIDGAPLAWRFSGCDKDGPFNWCRLDPGEKFKAVLDRLHEFETKTWEQLKSARCHPIPIEQLQKVARDRLKEIERDDIDELMAFHISGAERLWCIKDGNIMRVLWWDPKHQVYKTEKDRADRAKRKKKSR